MSGQGRGTFRFILGFPFMLIGIAFAVVGLWFVHLGAWIGGEDTTPFKPLKLPDGSGLDE